MVRPLGLDRSKPLFAESLGSVERMTTSRTPSGGVADNPGRPLGGSALGASTGARIPVPARERKPALAALAVLLILGGALASAYLVMASGHRVSVIRISQQVAPGQQVPEAALQEIQISATSQLDYVPWTDRVRVGQTFADVTLVQGSLLTYGMISTTNGAGVGTVKIGLALKPGQLPAEGLQPGDRVALYAVASATGATGTQSGAVLSRAATVVEVAQPGAGSLQSGQTLVSVAVPADEAPQVTEAASQGAVAVAVLPPGGQAPAQPPAQPGLKPSTKPSTGSNGRLPNTIPTRGTG